MGTHKNLGSFSPVLAAAGPVLCVAVSYVGPGKWVSSIEGGARLGYDVALFMLIMSLIGIVYQYLSACIAIATSKNVAHICREEYGNEACLFLGIQAVMSMILLDLTMVLGIAYGLNAISGIDLFYCILLTGLDTAIIPFLPNFVGNPRLKFVPICSASFALLSYFFGVLVTQPERSLSMGGMLDKLSGENAYALMALLGANVMPHNFYLHSAMVQVDQGQASVSKLALCHYHFFATLCIFSGIFMADCTLMNLSANVFYDSGLVSLGLLDALSLLEQVFRSPAGSFCLLVFMFFLNHLIALTWSMSRQVITEDLFRLEIPGWIYRATIRTIAIIPALYCVWYAGAEGVFQLVIFSRVLVALLLPSSVIPLFRIASCKSIMGEFKVSQVVEVVAFFSIIGMLGLKIVFIMEMIFGTSEWVGGLSWNLGSIMPIPYLILSISISASILFSLCLVTTPLRSASRDAQGQRWHEKAAAANLSLEGDKAEISEVPFHIGKYLDRQESAVELEKSITEHKDISIPCTVLNLPETLLDFDSDLQWTTIHDRKCDITSPEMENVNLDESAVSSETPAKIDLPDAGSLITEAMTMLSVESNVQAVKNDDVALEPEELGKAASEGNQSSTLEGSGSFKNSSGGIEDAGSSTGSLSRLCGLGRSARRQLTAILDEFWGQLFGYHGEATEDAKEKKLDVLLGVDFGTRPKPFSSVKLENTRQLLTGYTLVNSGTASDPLHSSGHLSSSNQQLGQRGLGSSHDLQQRSSLVPKPIGFFDSYGQNSNFNMVDTMERRYFSLRTTSSSDVYDQQPATVHGYDMSSYLGQLAKEGGGVSALSQPDSSSNPSVMLNPVNLYGRQSSHKPLSGLRNQTPPGFHNVPAARNSAFKAERYMNDLYAFEAEDRINSPSDVKKFHSLPSISRLYSPQRDPSMSMINEHSVSRPAHEQIASSWARTAYEFNDLFTPNVHDDALSLQFRSNSVSSSPWSKQPFEHFGVAGNSPTKLTDTARIVDVEAKLLQSFRSCIVKLLMLEGSHWLFSQNDGVDEDVISRVASREKFLYEVENRSFDRKIAASLQINEVDLSKLIPVPNCGEGCVWGVDLIISFGVWCIHRILDLSLIESRPELWGKYTYVLNRLQGIIDPAFSKPRSPRTFCFCLQLPDGYQKQRCGSPISQTSMPPSPPKLCSSGRSQLELCCWR